MKRNQMLRLGVRAVMSVFLGVAFVAASALAAPSPAVVGDWQGSLTTGGGSLRIVVHISADKDGNLTATMDSPDQGATGIAVTSVSFKDPDLHFEVQNIGGSYDGKINKDNSAITGTWQQGTASLPLILTRVSK
jgi:hypothetical protein